jgi:hypothetical protein
MPAESSELTDMLSPGCTWIEVVIPGADAKSGVMNAISVLAKNSQWATSTRRSLHQLVLQQRKPAMPVKPV